MKELIFYKNLWSFGQQDINFTKYNTKRRKAKKIKKKRNKRYLSNKRRSKRLFLKQLGDNFRTKLNNTKSE